MEVCMTEIKEKIVIVRETTFGSIISDMFSFGIIVASFWFNYTFIGGNDALDALLFITFFTMSFSHIKNYKRFFEDLKEQK